MEGWQQRAPTPAYFLPITHPPLSLPSQGEKAPNRSCLPSWLAVSFNTDRRRCLTTADRQLLPRRQHTYSLLGCSAASERNEKSRSCPAPPPAKDRETRQRERTGHTPLPQPKPLLIQSPSHKNSLPPPSSSSSSPSRHHS